MYASRPNLAASSRAAGTIGRSLEDDRRLRTESNNSFEVVSNANGTAASGAPPSLVNYGRSGFNVNSFNVSGNSATTTPADHTVGDEAPSYPPLRHSFSDYSIQSAVTMSPNVTPRISCGTVNDTNAAVTLGGQVVFSNLLNQTRDLAKASFRASQMERTATRSIDEDEETVDESASSEELIEENGEVLTAGAEDDDVDAEIARVEAQLEVARLEAKLKALKARKQQSKGGGVLSRKSSPVPSKKAMSHEDIPTSVGSESPLGGLVRQASSFSGSAEGGDVSDLTPV
jgi:hypothetical protein